MNLDYEKIRATGIRFIGASKGNVQKKYSMFNVNFDSFLYQTKFVCIDEVRDL